MTAAWESAASRFEAYRLVIPGSRFYASIKWVDRLELTADCPDNVAEQLVQAREEAGDTHCGFCH